MLIKILLYIELAYIKGSFRFSAPEASYCFVGVFFQLGGSFAS